LLGICGDGVRTAREWFDGVRKGRLRPWVTAEEREARWKQRVAALEKVKDKVVSVLDHFRNVSR
jgi:hypothetical protein